MRLGEAGGRLRRFGGRRPYLVVRPTNGLANRLQGVTSSAALARHLGLRFAIHWAPGKGFSEEGFRDLFANDFELWDRDRYEAALAGEAPRVSEWLGDRRRPPHPSFDPGHALEDIRRWGLVYDETPHDLDVRLRRRGVAIPRAVRRARKRCVRALRPAPAIARRVEAFAREHFTGHPVVGVHIRRGDSLAAPTARAYLAATDEAFAAAMQRVLEARTSTRFFLATDCQKSQEAFVGRFPGRVLCAQKAFVESVYDAPKGGQSDALVDMLLLSRTRWVLGSGASSFGRLAARIGDLSFRAAEG